MKLLYFSDELYVVLYFIYWFGKFLYGLFLKIVHLETHGELSISYLSPECYFNAGSKLDWHLRLREIIQ